MSSIFRNSFDDSSGSSSVENSYDEAHLEGEKNGHGGTPKPSTENVPLSTASGSLVKLGNSEAPSLDPSQQKNIFFLSLIEGRCRPQAAVAINKDRHLVD